MKTLLDSFNEKLSNKSTREIVQMIKDYRVYVTSGIHPENSTFHKMTTEICDLYGSEFNVNTGRSTLEYQVFERFLDTHDQAHKAKKKELNRLAAAKHAFSKEMLASPNKCYCAYDEYGTFHPTLQTIDWDNPVDFYCGTYKCTTCGRVQECHLPELKREATFEHYIYNRANYDYLDHKHNGHEVSKNQPDYEKIFFYGYGHNNIQFFGYWGEDVTYALFNSYNEFIGEAKFVGLRLFAPAVAGYAGGAAAFFESGTWEEPEKYEAPVFRFIDDGSLISHVTAIPIHLFAVIPPEIFGKFNRYGSKN